MRLRSLQIVTLLLGALIAGGCIDMIRGPTPPIADGLAAESPGGGGSAGAGETAPAAAPSFDPACIHPEARGPARTTKLLPAWQGSPPELLARLAQALDDPLRDEPREENDALVVNTTSGTLEYWLPAHDYAPGQMTWRTTRDASAWRQAEAEAWLRTVVDRFAGAEDGDRIDIFADYASRGWALRFGQHVYGQQVANAGGSADNDFGLVLYWGPAYALPDPVEIRERQAREAAEPYATCVLERSGMNATAGYGFHATDEMPPFVVTAESLAYRVHVRFTEPEPHTHCGTSLYVDVDALTGAVVGHEPPLCA